MWIVSSLLRSLGLPPARLFLANVPRHHVSLRPPASRATLGGEHGGWCYSQPGVTYRLLQAGSYKHTWI